MLVNLYQGTKWSNCRAACLTFMLYCLPSGLKILQSIKKRTALHRSSRQRVFRKENVTHTKLSATVFGARHHPSSPGPDRKSSQNDSRPCLGTEGLPGMSPGWAAVPGGKPESDG